MDEKSGMQTLDRSHPVLPTMPGVPERRSHDYARHGITSLFAAFNVADGTMISEIHRQHRVVEFKKSLVTIDKAVSAGRARGLWQPGHAQDASHQGLGQAPPLPPVFFTPTGSSWINQVAPWFGFLAERLLRRGVHRSVTALEKRCPVMDQGLEQ